MINSNLLVTNTTNAFQNVVFILANPPNKVNPPKVPKVVPNILNRNRQTCEVIIQPPNNPNKPTQTEKRVPSPKIPTITLDSDDEGSETYVLNQTDLATLPLQSTGHGENPMENSAMEEIFVTKDQVHVLNQPTVSSEIQTRTCRTCLSSMSPEKCTKLFDTVNKDKSDNLQRKITYIAGNIDFSATYDPGICSKCVTLIDIAYKFKKKVTEVEGRINDRRYIGGVNTMVSLRKLKRTKCGIKETVHESNTSNSENVNIQNVVQEKVTAEGNAEENNGNSDVAKVGEPFKSVEDYLAKRENFIYRIFSEEIEPEEVKPKEVPVKKPEARPRQQNFRSIDIDPITCRPNYPGSNKTNETQTLNPQNTTQTSRILTNRKKKTFGVGRLETKISTDNLFSNVNFRVKKTPESDSGKKWAVLDESFSVRKGVEAARLDCNQEEQNPAYKYLFGDKRSVQKIILPKTQDVFDEEHDRYFKQVQGEAGRMMMRKWRRFARNAVTMGSGPYLCEFCGFSAESWMRFKKHSYRHAPKTKTMCSYCGKFLSTIVGLREHIQCKHKPPTFQCTFCGKMFHLANLLSNHVLTVHSETKKRYQCHHCGKFVSYSCLKLHMDKHSGAKFPCDVCHKVFRARYSLHIHRRRHFRGYRCKYCTNLFSSSSVLRQHVLQIHKGVRFKCTICGKLLSRKANVLRHYKVQHGEVPQMKKQKEDSGDETDYQEAIIDVVYEKDPASARELYENFSNEMAENSEAAVKVSSEKVEENRVEEVVNEEQEDMEVNEYFDEELEENVEENVLVGDCNEETVEYFQDELPNYF